LKNRVGIQRTSQTPGKLSRKEGRVTKEIGLRDKAASAKSGGGKRPLAGNRKGVRQSRFNCPTGREGYGGEAGTRGAART